MGSERCFPMYYEQLVLHPEAQMRELLAFLDLPWNSSVLHHSDFVGSEISLSKVRTLPLSSRHGGKDGAGA